MAIELGGLAARLKAGIEAAAAAKEAELSAAAREAEARKAASAAAAVARAEMMAALKTLAEGVGHFDVKAGKDSLVVSYEGKELRFAPEGEGDRIAVSTKGRTKDPHFLTRDSVGDWEVVLVHGDDMRRLPVEYGLEELIGIYLAVAPEESAPSAPMAREEVTVPKAPAKTVSKPAPPVQVAEAAPARPRERSRAPRTPPGSGLKEKNSPFD
jgi:hypothetical protein